MKHTTKKWLNNGEMIFYKILKTCRKKVGFKFYQRGASLKEYSIHTAEIIIALKEIYNKDDKTLDNMH